VLWQQLPSLLNSPPNALVYRVEIDDQGAATAVFGQGGSGSSGQQFGLRPTQNAKITAKYRVGGGAVGNVGADTLVQPHPAGSAPIDWFKKVTNPLAATGGRDLESRDHARRFAPATFKRPLVAVTTADYQSRVQDFRNPDGSRPVQRANAAFRWSGSWLSVTLGVDPAGAEALSSQLRTDLLSYLDGVRLTGYDLDVTGVTFVPVDLVIGFCVVAGFFPAAVEQRILLVLSNGDLPASGKGFFHPDNFGFGDDLYVSRLHKAVMSVAGVESARIIRLARLHAANPDGDTRRNLGQGFLAIGPNEIVRLDNDRNFPERGVLSLVPLV
jgi:predicted phage baseplate assembly protein